MSDPVNHPQHYNAHPSGVECIQVTEHMNFCIGNAVKYLWRAGLKGDALEDLKKAKFYVEREIARRGGSDQSQVATSDDLVAALREATETLERLAGKVGITPYVALIARLRAAVNNAECDRNGQLTSTATPPPPKAQP